MGAGERRITARDEVCCSCWRGRKNWEKSPEVFACEMQGVYVVELKIISYGEMDLRVEVEKRMNRWWDSDAEVLAREAKGAYVEE